MGTILGVKSTLTPVPVPTPMPDAPATPIPTLAPGALGTATLRYGVRSDAVSALQTRLKQLGYYTYDATGYFDTTTRAAVRAYQRANGLTADGIVGSATRAKLSGEAADVDTGTPQPAVTIAPAGNGNDDSLGASTLKKGMTSEAVLSLQRRLLALGDYKGALSGTFGTLIKQAVMDFQRANALRADGVAGPATRFKLNGMAATSSPDPSTIPNYIPSAATRGEAYNGNIF